MKFGSWLKGGGSGKGSTQKWIVRLRMVDKRLDRQRRKLLGEEKKMMKEVKEAVARGDMSSARLFAKDVSKSRNMALGCQSLRSQVKGMTFKLQQAQAVQSIGQDLKGMVRALHQVNRTLRVPELEKVLGQMETEMGRLDLTTESIDEGFDMISMSENEDVEVDKIIGEITAGEAAVADSGLPTADVRSQELAKELKKLKDKGP